MSKMKMSDVFALPVYRGVQEVNIHNKERPCIISGTNTTVIARPKYIEATIHAINNHDRMVEEIAELRKGLEIMIEQFESDHNCEYEYNIIRWNKDLLARLNQEGEE